VPGSGQREGQAWTAAAAVVSVALWASTFAVFKLVFHRLDPLAFTGARYLLLVPLAAGYLWRGRGTSAASPKDRRAAIVAGLLGYFLLEFLFVLGLARTTAVASAVLVATHPMWGVLFASLAARHRPPVRAVVGLLVGIAGVVVFVGAAGLGAVRAGDLLSLAAAIAFGAYAAIIERIGARVPQGEMVATSLLSGGIALVLVSAPAMLRQDWSAAVPGDWLGIAYGALGSVLLGFALWAWALKRRGMARTAPFGYLEPVFASALAVVVLGETFATHQFVGGALVLAGVIAAASAEAGLTPGATVDVAATMRP